MADKLKTSPVLARAVAHYEATEVRHIDVPEWPDENGAPTVIFWRAGTLAQEDVIRARFEKTGSRAGLMVDTITARALDEDGNKMFTVADKPGLMKSADGAVVSRIYLAMETGAGVEDREKN